MHHIQDFFAAYAQSYLTLDAKQIAPFFQMPCLVIDQSGQHVLNDFQSVVTYENPFLTLLGAHGVNAIHTSVIACHVVSENLEFASVQYELFSNAELFADFDYHYSVIVNDQTRRIAFAHYGNVRAWVPEVNAAQ